MISALTRSAGVTMFVACIYAVPVAGTVRPQGTVTLSYLLPEHVTLHEPVILDIVVDNQSEHPVNLDLGWRRIEKFRLALLKPDGQIMPPRAKDPEGVSLIGQFSVAASERYRQWIALDELVDFDTIGRYALTVQFVGGIGAVPDVLVRVDRNQTIPITVLPRDEDTLRATCAKFAGVTLESMNADRYMRAATALAWVRDPVAVPYLRQIA